MPSSFDEAMGGAQAALEAAFGEPVTYHPASGPAATVTAILDRGQLAPVGELGGKVGAVPVTLTIARSAIAQIGRGDYFEFPDTQGGTATAHHDVQVDKARTDAAFWVLHVR